MEVGVVGLVFELEGGWFGGEDCPVVRGSGSGLVVVDFLRGGSRWAVWRDEFGVAGMEAVASGALEEELSKNWI